MYHFYFHFANLICGKAVVDGYFISPRYTLGEEDMAEIAKLDIGHSEIVDHYSPAFVKMLHGMKIHE